MTARDPGARTAREMARAYAAVGWPVFPLAPGGKLPAIPGAHPVGDPARASCKGECGRLGHGFHDATTDPAVIDRWWDRNPACNVGIATGAPGPDVLDIDVHEDGNGFAALNRVKRAGLAGGRHAIVKTPSTGFHMYYRGTDQGNGSLRGQHIDFRGKGGYVVAPPSSTPAGSYVVVEHHAEATATLDWRNVREVLEPEALRRQRELASQSRRWGAGPGDEGRVDRLANFVASGVSGDRNYRVFWAAKRLELSGQLDGPATESLVRALAQADPGVDREREARRTIESGRQAAQRAGGQQAPGKDPAAAAEQNGGGRRPFVPLPDAGAERQREAG
jgi:Bifunctional DNA primase/polymerase, N-terminal